MAVPTSHDDFSRRPVGHFESTLWTVVLEAGSAETTQARSALEQLCRAYWYPIYAHVRRAGHPPSDAQDLTQGFFAHLLAQGALHGLSPEKGRFRAFLLAALRHYLADARDRQQAAKRGGGRPLLSLDETSAEGRYALEPARGNTPDKEFDRRWALAVLERALDALEREQRAAGKQPVFDRLREFLTEATGAGDYSAVAAELHLAPNTVAVMVRRLRQRYRQLVRAEIAETLVHPGEVDAEMGHLLEALRG